MPTIPKTFNPDKPRFKKNPNDFFVTPDELALACVSLLHGLQYNDESKILDVGCGTGVWGKAARKTYPLAKLTGVDVVSFPDFNLSSIYDYVYYGDYLSIDLFTKYDLIIGNPPYSSVDNDHLAEDIVLRSLTLLTDNGYLGLLLKTEFKASARRYKNIFLNNAPLFEYQCVQRPNWQNYKKGSNTIEYSFFIWRKQPTYETVIRWLSWR